MIIDEDDITVGRTLYFINNRTNSDMFVGKITDITYIGSVEGARVRVDFPLKTGFYLYFSISQIKDQIENESIVIK